MTELQINPTPSFPLWLDNTALSDYKSCQKKFNWSSIQKFDPTPTSVHLHAGSAFARGLEVTRRAYFVEGIKDPEVCIGRGLAALWQVYGDFETPDDSAKSWVGMSHALIHYFTRWKLGEDYIIPLLIGQEHAIEFSFAVPIPIKHPETGDPLMLTGRADMFGKFQDSLWCLDEKTTKGIGPMWAQQWGLRAQFMQYTWAARQYGYNVKGAIIRGISIQKTGNKDAECVKPFSDHVIDRWYESTLDLIEDMIATWRKGKWRYDFSHACTAYSGCPYARLCEAPVPERWLMYYQPRTWNPLHLPDAS